MVMNVGALKSGDHETVRQDIHGVAEAAHRAGAILKVILETVLLDDNQKAEACTLAKLAGADFVKTSTGFASGGATAHDVALMRFVVGPEMGVKASGGMKPCSTPSSPPANPAYAAATTNAVNLYRPTECPTACARSGLSRIALRIAPTGERTIRSAITIAMK